MVDITERLRQMDADGCRPVGDDSCTCVVLLDAIAEIDRLRADVERLEGALRNSIPAVPDDGYLPGLNSTMCDAPIRSPEEQFTRRMLKEAIARCLFPGLPPEREWMWGRGRLRYRDNEFSYSKVASVVLFWNPYNKDQEYNCAPIWPKVWDKAWRETGMEDR